MERRSKLPLRDSITHAKGLKNVLHLFLLSSSLSWIPSKLIRVFGRTDKLVEWASATAICLRKIDDIAISMLG